MSATVGPCTDRATGSTIVIVPAGPANLFAKDLDIPEKIEVAVHIGLRERRSVSVTAAV